MKKILLAGCLLSLSTACVNSTINNSSTPNANELKGCWEARSDPSAKTAIITFYKYTPSSEKIVTETKVIDSLEDIGGVSKITEISQLTAMENNNFERIPFNSDNTLNIGAKATFTYQIKDEKLTITDIFGNTVGPLNPSTSCE